MSVTPHPGDGRVHWLTVLEAAEHAGVSTDIIYGACLLHELKHVRVAGRRSIRLRLEWVDEWLEQYATGVETHSG